jgi:hypothetical protein
VFETLASSADNEYVMIDSTIVKAHQHSAGGRKKGSSKLKPSDAARGGLSTKIYATVDAQG